MKQPPQPAPAEGQIWKENRYDRYVLVLGLRGSWVQIITMEQDGRGWTRKRGAHSSWRRTNDFDGKMRGFSFFQTWRQPVS